MEWVTKSVRLAPEEAMAMARLAEEQGCSEGSLLRRWAVEGIQEMMFDRALLQYTKGVLSLEQAAEQAALSTGTFQAELLRRGVFGPGYAHEEPAEWLKGLSQVARRMGLPQLAELASDLSHQSEGPAAALAVTPALEPGSGQPGRGRARA